MKILLIRKSIPRTKGERNTIPFSLFLLLPQLPCPPSLTRPQQCGHIHIPKVHLEVAKRSFYFTGAMEFNSRPRLIKSKESFYWILKGRERFFYFLDVRAGSDFVTFCIFLSLLVIYFFVFYVFLITGPPLITVFITLTVLSCINIIALLY